MHNKKISEQFTSTIIVFIFGKENGFTKSDIFFLGYFIFTIKMHTCTSVSFSFKY